MNRLITFILTLVCVLGLVGCSAKNEYAVRIVVPAGNNGEFVYSEEIISPRKNQLDIKSIDMSEDAIFLFMPVDETRENVYECTDFPKGEPMLIDAEKGAWYKIAIAKENPTDEDIVVVFHITNAKVRIT